MKLLGALLLAGLQLAAGLPSPQHDHGDASGGDDHHAPATTSAAPAGPAPSGTTPAGCKLLKTDAGYPAAAAWTAALPGVMPLGNTAEGDTRPDYVLSAKTVAQVQSAVRFAAANNIRLSVINSGHDFVGRNDAPSGLLLDVSGLGGIKVLPSYTPSAAGASSPSTEVNTIPKGSEQAAVTFGAGVSTQVLNNALDASGLFTMGAAHGSVKTAGGFGQTAGHGPLTSKYGLGVDQVLEYKVVTPDGQLKVANKVSNPDLFWALRGGGPSTFGVVVEATVKAYATPKITVTNWWLNATNAASPSQGYWDSVAYLHSIFPEINAQGVQGYYYVYPAAMKGIFLTAGTDAGAEKANATWAPIYKKLESFAGNGKITAKYTEYTSYKHYFDTRFGSIDCPSSAHRKRHEDMVTNPSGITPMDSRLLGASHLKSPQLAAALKAALPLVPEGQLRGHLTAGGKVLKPDDETSAATHWRKAYVHLIATGAGAFMSDSFRSIAPDSGAYVNEASIRNPDWKNAFWGSNYARLSQIKTQVDPNGVFYVTPGINADHYEVKDGRVCKLATPVTTSLAPSGDNKNIIRRAGASNEDVLSDFPGVEGGTGGHADDGHAHGEPMGCDAEVPDDDHHGGETPGGDDHHGGETPGGDDHHGGETPGGDDHHGGEMPDDGHGGHGEAPSTEIPAGVYLEPDLKSPTDKPGVTSTKIRYGPWTVEGGGMLANRPILRPATPCKDCYITAIQAGLEYADGSVANVNTGAWLHHMLISVRGTGKSDLVCGRRGVSALMGQRWFASGNERAVMRVNSSSKHGLKLNSADSVSMIVDLMNEATTSKTLYLTLTWEWLPVAQATGYKEAAVAWLDVGGCGSSNVPAREGVFNLTSPGWKSTVAGRMLYSTGHVHDGGLYTAILQNGKEVCRSQQLYGRKPEYIPPMVEGGHGHGGASISDSAACVDFGQIKVGDDLKVLAHYDTSSHGLAAGHEGEAHDIMGISRVIIGL